MTFETYLMHALDDVTPSKVKDAMQYSLMNGGKRIRPRLLLEILKGYGDSEEKGYACAAGIEMIHTYSLIHDDLPAMDNDTLRRGKPTCHIAFDEATAILAGDGLLTQSFAFAANTCEDPIKNMEIVKLFVKFSGSDGMIFGQVLDIAAEHQTSMKEAELERVHYYKTGRLLTLPMVCAAIISNHRQDIEVWEKVGEYIGLSFQIQDDLLDVLSTSDELGKNINSDVDNGKPTYATIMSIPQAQKLCDEYYTKAKLLVNDLDFDTTGLYALFDILRERKK